MATAKCWLRLEPTWRHSYIPDSTGDHTRLDSVKVAGVTQKRPLSFNGAVVELTITIPDGAFKPLRPHVEITIPEAALNFEPEVSVTIPEAQP